MCVCIYAPSPPWTCGGGKRQMPSVQLQHSPPYPLEIEAGVTGMHPVRLLCGCQGFKLKFSNRAAILLTQL